MSDSLKIFGTNYTGVTGIKATDTNDTIKTYIRPEGNKAISANGTNIDVTNYATVSVNVSSSSSLQNKTKTYTPTTSQQTETITADSGYDGLSSVGITVNAMTAGSASTPATTITANLSISISSTGLITATASSTKSVTPSVTAGYVSSGTAGTITVSGSNTQQLSTKAAATITPGISNQTIAAGTYLTGTQTIAGDADLTAANIKAGVQIFGVTGSYTSDANATAADIKSSKTAYVNGSKVTGTLSFNSILTGTLAPSSQLGSNGDVYIQTS